MTDTSAADAFLNLEERGINYLLIANGAGLASCLATLKDYATTPQLKGIGFLVGEFGLGILLASGAFVFLQAISISVRTIADTSSDSRAVRVLILCQNAMAIASMGCFVMAIITIMSRLKDL